FLGVLLLLGLLGLASRDGGPTCNSPKGLLDLRSHIRLGEIAHDHERRVLGLIKAIIKLLAVRRGDRVEIFSLADRRMSVRMFVKRRLTQQRGRPRERFLIVAFLPLPLTALATALTGLGKKQRVAHPPGREAKKKPRRSAWHLVGVARHVLG